MMGDRRGWGSRLAAALFVVVLLAVVAPAAAVAAPSSHARFPHAPGRMLPYGHGPRAPMAVAGTVVEAGDGELTLEVERHGRGRHAQQVEVTLTVGDDALLLAPDLARLELADLEEGQAVLVAPKVSWGTPAVQVLFAGTPEELADVAYRGRLESQDGDTLQLQQHRGDDDLLTVLVDADTVWLEHGRAGRPDALPEGIPLRVLGVEQEDGTVRAVLITTGAHGL